MEDTAIQAALDELHALPGHLLWRAAARVSRALDTILPVGTDIHAYAVLLALADAEPRSQRRLAQLTGVSGTTITSVAADLQGEALVERVRNPDDRRSYALTRTPAGRSAVRRWTPHVDRLEEQLTASLAREDAARLRQLLQLVIGERLDPGTPPALLGSTAFLVSKAHQRTHRELLTALAPLGIEPRHFGTLRALQVAGAATQGEVAALLEVSPATVVQIVDHLEARGLVTRERAAADRRAYRLDLTVAARPVLEEALTMAGRLLEDRVGGPRSPDRRDLVRLLRLLLSGVAVQQASVETGQVAD